MKRQSQMLQCQMDWPGVLARHVPTRLVEISRSGCLLESSHRIEEGTVGALRLDVGGRTFSEDVRATRCVALAGSGSSFLVGVEFLGTGHVDGTSIRQAIANALKDVTSGNPGLLST